MGRQRLPICTLFQGIRSLDTETGAASDGFIPKWFSCKSPEAFLPLPDSRRYSLHMFIIHTFNKNSSCVGKGQSLVKDNISP